MNITDVDDKILKGAAEKGYDDFVKYARVCEKSFFEDLAALNIEVPDQITRVTEFVDEIVNFVKKLVSNGVAYEANGSVYFDVEKHKENGNVIFYSKKIFLVSKFFGNFLFLDFFWV